ncbi:hypothetical protein BDV93DRAFT_548433 [Ceratobasidium sp. AG-I]|nr:hypothetical protein BDV93DRAFT_548433 [Ceratobasidium sp. AG-I]
MISLCLRLGLAAGLLGVGVAGEGQKVLGGGSRGEEEGAKAIERDSFGIFREVNSLLRQWGNALSPNGFSVTLASVPANTLLYHARTDADEPSSPEWFALDAEMSYGIYGGRQNTSVFLRTYRTTTTLGPLLYFNGLSAALTFSGTLDSQDLLVPPSISNSTDMPNPFEDYARAERLCKWASTRSVKGFVRTNAGFEVLWCDMNAGGLKLLRNANVTHWAGDMDDHSSRRGSDKDGERGGGGHRGPPSPHPPPAPPLSRFGNGDLGELPPFPRHPGPGPGRRPPGGGGFSMFARYASWEWLRAASHTYDGLGEARVKLHSGWHVTARGMIGSVDESGLGVARMASLPAESIAQWREDVDTMLRMAIHERRETSGADWRALTDVIVARYGDRLPQLSALLKSVFESRTSGPASDGAYISITNTTAQIKHAYRLVSSLVLPFFDSNVPRDQQIEICGNSILPDFTPAEGDTDLLNQFERKLWTAIIHVHRSICTVLIDVHSELTALRPYNHAFTSSDLVALEASPSSVEKLMSELDWTTWVRCPEVCAWGEVCFVPIWPLFGFGTWNWTMGGRLEPQCVGSEGSHI